MWTLREVMDVWGKCDAIFVGYLSHEGFYAVYQHFADVIPSDDIVGVAVRRTPNGPPVLICDAYQLRRIRLDELPERLLLRYLKGVNCLPMDEAKLRLSADFLLHQVELA